MSLGTASHRERVAEEAIPRNDRTSARGAAAFSVITSTRFDDVEKVWRRLEAHGIESPGQSFDFLKIWMQSFAIPERERMFVIAYVGERPVVALALQRIRRWGLDVLRDFPGGHVGTNAPLVDKQALRAMTPSGRRALWRKIGAALDGAGLLFVSGVMAAADESGDMFAEFGMSVTSDTLHRSVFCTWADADREQRNRSRRKHDKQQGARLGRMGEVAFEALDPGCRTDDVLATMFAQRGERFAEQGITDPFDDPRVRAFYAAAFEGGGPLKGRLHVLRLNGEIVAVRYNLIHGERMFCLISSMSTAPRIQPGSPGKQCLLKVMQTEFDNGFRMFDMGEGMTDEKRHWCNVHIPVRHHYLPLSLRGYAVANAHRLYQAGKTWLKSQDRLFERLKRARARLRGGKV